MFKKIINKDNIDKLQECKIFAPVKYTSPTTGEIWYKAITDKDGFIVNQRLLTSVPFGSKTSEYNGCGWIATYNACKLLDMDKSFKDIVNYYEPKLFLKGLIGLSLWTIIKYFRKNKCKVKFVLTREKLNKIADEKSAYIMFYVHKNLKGAHFVAFGKAKKYRENVTYAFYNATNTRLIKDGQKVPRIIKATSEIYNDAGDLEPYEVEWDSIYAYSGKEDRRNMKSFLKCTPFAIFIEIKRA